MKNYHLIIIAFLIASINCFAQSDKTLLQKPEIDERVELVSILARLAEFKEYNQEIYPVYVHDIHAWFDPYKEHPAVKLLRELREKTGLGYDQLMTMAVHLSQPPNLDPLLTFSETIPDERWGKEAANKFAGAIKDFYKISSAKVFFNAHKTLYEDVLKRYELVLNQLDINWYKTFYGELPEGTFNIVLGLGNGWGNYGPKVVYPGKKEDLYAIESIGKIDNLNMPDFTVQDYLPTLIHEFNHSFVNHLGDLYESSLEKSGKLIFDVVETEMNKHAYGVWKTMFNEALVRAAVIRYSIKHPIEGYTVTNQIADEETQGFYWMSSLVELLGKYEQNRDKYKRLTDFMPEIIAFYDSIAPKIKLLKEKYIKQCPSILSTAPLTNDTLVSPGLKEITFNFDKPLVAGRYGFGPTKIGLTHYTVPKGVKFTNENKTVIMTVELKPDTYYEIKVSGRMFRTPDGHRGLQDYLLSFKTASK